jgi:hypothetical protein
MGGRSLARIRVGGISRIMQVALLGLPRECGGATRVSIRMRTAGLVAVALVAAALTSCSSGPVGSHTVTLAKGLTVRLPPGSPRVTARAAPEAAASLTGKVHIGRRHASGALAILASAERITSSGPLPAGGATVTFHVKVPQGVTPFLASMNPATGRWMQVPSRYDQAAQTVSAHVLQFSVLAPLGWIKSRIAALLKGALLGTFDLAGTGSYPRCNSYDIAVDDSHPAGTSIGSCAQPEGSSHVLVKVADLRPYPVDVTYPAGSTADIPSDDPFVKLMVIASGDTRAMLPGLGEADVTLGLPAGHSAQLTTRLDGYAVRVALLETAIRLASEVGGGKAKAIIDRLDKTRCVADYLRSGSTARPDLRSVQEFGSTAFECVAAVLTGAAEIAVTGVILAASLVVGAVTASWAVIDKALGDASHVLTVKRSAAPNIVYFTQHGNLAAGEQPEVKPSCESGEDCVLFVGGSFTALMSMSWSSWTSTYANGTGSLDYSGAIGTATSGSVPVKVLFDNPKHCAGKDYWSQVDLSFPSGAPQALKTYLLKNSVSAEDQAFALPLLNVIGPGGLNMPQPLCGSGQ